MAPERITLTLAKSASVTIDSLLVRRSLCEGVTPQRFMKLPGPFRQGYD